MADSHDSPLADIRHEVSFSQSERALWVGSCICGYRSRTVRTKREAIQEMIDHISRALFWHGLTLATILLEIGYESDSDNGQ